MMQNRVFFTIVFIVIAKAFQLPAQTREDYTKLAMVSIRETGPVVSCFLSKNDNAILRRNCLKMQDTGKVKIIQDPKIEELLSKKMEINSKAAIKGYRVKIHFGADKNKAKEVKTKFMTQFPSVPAYEKYDQPNFNIRVGDFRTKLEAYKFLRQLQIEFPTAFIVQDEIAFPALETAEKKP